jgi:hypothetical protein
MTTLREAAEMALEALKQSRPKPCDEDDDYAELAWKKHTAAIDFLRKALDADSMASFPEPVAWRTFDGEGGYEFRDYDDNEEYQQRFIERNGEQYASWCEPLYTAPPLSMTISGDCATSRSSNRREWQGLTDEERIAAIESVYVQIPFDLKKARAIEAKLKEKNT